ncbi:MAG: hypothetical protein JW754_04685 [Candidatus Aenigmarchaeota archaeon]|nr:hypothetical protein [Candidatus Aenigmarchaeota archaeon]
MFNSHIKTEPKAFETTALGNRYIEMGSYILGQFLRGYSWTHIGENLMADYGKYMRKQNIAEPDSAQMRNVMNAYTEHEFECLFRRKPGSGFEESTLFMKNGGTRPSRRTVYVQHTEGWAGNGDYNAFVLNGNGLDMISLRKISKRVINGKSFQRLGDSGNVLRVLRTTGEEPEIVNDYCSDMATSDESSAIVNLPLINFEYNGNEQDVADATEFLKMMKTFYGENFSSNRWLFAIKNHSIGEVAEKYREAMSTNGERTEAEKINYVLLGAWPDNSKVVGNDWRTMTTIGKVSVLKKEKPKKKVSTPKAKREKVLMQRDLFGRKYDVKADEVNPTVDDWIEYSNSKEEAKIREAEGKGRKPVRDFLRKYLKKKEKNGQLKLKFYGSVSDIPIRDSLMRLPDYVTKEDLESDEWPEPVESLEITEIQQIERETESTETKKKERKKIRLPDIGKYFRKLKENAGAAIENAMNVDNAYCVDGQAVDAYGTKDNEIPDNPVIMPSFKRVKKAKGEKKAKTSDDLPVVAAPSSGLVRTGDYVPDDKGTEVIMTERISPKYHPGADMGPEKARKNLNLKKYVKPALVLGTGAAVVATGIMLSKMDKNIVVPNEKKPYMSASLDMELEMPVLNEPVEQEKTPVADSNDETDISGPKKWVRWAGREEEIVFGAEFEGNSVMIGNCSGADVVGIKVGNGRWKYARPGEAIDFDGSGEYQMAVFRAENGGLAVYGSTRGYIDGSSDQTPEENAGTDGKGIEDVQGVPADSSFLQIRGADPRPIPQPIINGTGIRGPDGEGNGKPKDILKKYGLDTDDSDFGLRFSGSRMINDYAISRFMETDRMSEEGRNWIGKEYANDLVADVLQKYESGITPWKIAKNSEWGSVTETKDVYDIIVSAERAGMSVKPSVRKRNWQMIRYMENAEQEAEIPMAA